MPRLLDAADAVLAPEVEAAQPLYARYWLHNRGPAPIGGLPAVAHLHPHRMSAEPNTEVRLRLTAASDCTDSALRGEVRLVCPDGWTPVPAELPFVLPRGDHLDADITLTMPPGTQRGLYPVRAQLTVSECDEGEVPPDWRQTVEDVCIVSVGTRLRRARGELLRLIRGPDEVTVTAGDTARLTVTIGTDARAELAAEAHLISPWETWAWMGPASLGAVLPAGGTAEVCFEVAPPAWVEPGQWWALIRVGCAGRLVYSPAVRVTVR